MSEARRILLLTYYFPPDFAAGSFRAEAMVRALRRNLPADVVIEVVTARPHRYGGRQSSLEYSDVSFGEGVSVHRLPVPRFSRFPGAGVLHFLMFAWHVMRLVRSRPADLVIGTSSRLGTASLACLVACRKKAALHLDIRDLFTDSLASLYPGSMVRLMLNPLKWVQNRILKTAQSITVTSPVHERYIRHCLRHPAVSWLPNGIDKGFSIQQESLDGRGDHPCRMRVVYAGNIGRGQALEHILPELALGTGDLAEWRIIGDGGRKKHLAAAILDAGVSNVQLLPPMPRHELLLHYRWADILFLHLNDSRAMGRVLPSKFFEYAATGKPILAGVNGYLSRFLSGVCPGVWCFSSGNAAQALAQLRQIRPDHYTRDDFHHQFDRERQMDSFCTSLMARHAWMRGDSARLQIPVQPAASR